MNEQEGRYLIFYTAYLQQNAHYLLGTRGAIPGGKAELGRSLALENNPKWDDLAICAGNNSYGNCYGRWAALQPKGYLFQPNTAKLEKLKEWVKTYKGHDPQSWPPFEGYGMTPRRTKKGAIAMGEDCRGKRHFDCIGFIYWVLNQVIPRSCWTDNIIKHYQKGFKSYHPVTGEREWIVKKLGPIPKSQLRNGDIVTRTRTNPDHIGIANEEGWVVHASREGEGVLYEPYKVESWDNVSRIESWAFL